MTNPLVGDLKQFLAADAGIAALVGSRIYPARLPQAVTYPALSYEQVSGIRVRDLLGPSGKVRRRVTVNSWALTNIQAFTVADAVRQALDGFDGWMGSTFVVSVILDNEIPLFEEEAGTVGVHRVIQDYIIGHSED
jgi:hypothetical protein